MRFYLSILLLIWSLLSGLGSARCGARLEKRAGDGLDGLVSETRITVEGEKNGAVVCLHVCVHGMPKLMNFLALRLGFEFYDIAWGA